MFCTPSPSTPTTVAARFRTTFNREPLTSDLHLNPALTPAQMEAALFTGTVDRLLPDPWSPKDAPKRSAAWLCLTKMKSVICFGTPFAALSSSFELAEVAQQRFGVLWSVPLEELAVFEAFALLTAEGLVTRQVSLPAERRDLIYSESDSDFQEWGMYTQLMIALGIAKLLESSP